MTETHDRHGYPLHGFFVAHRLSTGANFPPGGTWHDILDGPQVDDEAVIDAIIEAWRHDRFAPDRDDLRVWQIIPGKVVEDVTEWAVRTVAETLEMQAEEDFI